MKVIFLNGDIKNVSDGYARNFLLPRKLAQVATKDSEKLATALKTKHEARKTKNAEEATKIAEQLAGITLTITETANDEGHLFGSVDAKRIAQELKKQHGIAIDPDTISLDAHIKTTGEHEIEVDLYPDIRPRLKLMIVSAMIQTTSKISSL